MIKGSLRVALVGAAAIGMCAASGAGAQTAGSAGVSALGTALERYAARHGVRLRYEPATVAGRAAGASGDAAKLKEVLAGTDLVARRIDATTIAIEPASQQATLGTVRVGDTIDADASATSDPVASEGTGSYAARGTSLFKSPATIRETPLTVSTLTRQRLDDQNLFDVRDAFVQLPGITVTSNGGEDVSLRSRGYDVNTEVDGVPLSYGGRASRFDTAIYDRIEALRGPAGVLQGVGGIGGTVNLVRKRPTKEFSSTGQLSGGSWNDYRGAMDIGGPLDQRGAVRARFVGAYQDQDYFYDYVNRTHLTAYGVVEADLGPNTTLGVTASYTHSDRRGQYYGIPQALSSQVKRSTYPGVRWSGARLDAYELGADITHDFGGGWMGKARYIHRKSDYDYIYLVPLGSPDAADAFVPFLAFEPQGNDTNDGIDASVSGPIRALGGDHRLTVGGNYDRSSTLSGSPSTIAFGNAIAPDIDPIAFDPNDDVTNYRLIQFAPYVDLKLDLATGLTLSAGTRYNHYHYDYRYFRTSGDTDFTPYGRSKGRFVPYGGLVWDATKQISFYASYADIYTPQTQRDFSDNILPPTVGWQGEAGAKASFLDNHLTATLAYYRIRERNRLFPDPDPTHVDCGGSGGTCYLALGLVRSQGVDAEVTGSPINGLQLQASYTFNANKYLRDGYEQAGQAFTNSSPKHQFKLWGVYQFGRMQRADAGRFSVGGGAIAQSRIYFDDKAFGQKAYAVFNGQIGYRPTENSHLTLTVNNLFDRRYLDSVGSYNFFGEPRSVLVSLRFGR